MADRLRSPMSEEELAKQRPAVRMALAAIKNGTDYVQRVLESQLPSDHAQSFLAPSKVMQYLPGIDLLDIEHEGESKFLLAGTYDPQKVELADIEKAFKLDFKARGYGHQEANDMLRHLFMPAVMLFQSGEEIDQKSQELLQRAFNILDYDRY